MCGRSKACATYLPPPPHQKRSCLPTCQYPAQETVSGEGGIRFAWKAAAGELGAPQVTPSTLAHTQAETVSVALFLRWLCWSVLLPRTGQEPFAAVSDKRRDLRGDPVLLSTAVSCPRRIEAERTVPFCHFICDAIGLSTPVAGALRFVDVTPKLTGREPSLTHANQGGQEEGRLLWQLKSWMFSLAVMGRSARDHTLPPVPEKRGGAWHQPARPLQAPGFFFHSLG